MCIHDDATAVAVGKWQCTSALLVGKLYYDEDGQYPAIQIAAAQVRQCACSHQSVQGTRGTHIPGDCRIAEPEACINRGYGAKDDGEPLMGSIIPREQRPHEHQAKAVEGRMAEVQMDDMSRQQTPQLTCAERGPV